MFEGLAFVIPVLLLIVSVALNAFIIIRINKIENLVVQLQASGRAQTVVGERNKTAQRDIISK